METIAIYREEVIKTYGFSERKGLCLVTLDLPALQMDQWGNRVMEHLARLEFPLTLLMAQSEEAGTLRLFILMEGLPEQFRTLGLPAGIQGERRLYPAVEMISFQGPHFGDRYGITQAVLRVMADHQVPILGLICSGASVYLLIDRGWAGPARKALGEAFLTPPKTGASSD